MVNELENQERLLSLAASALEAAKSGNEASRIQGIRDAILEAYRIGLGGPR